MYRANNFQKRNSMIETRISFLVLAIIIFIVIFTAQFFSKSILDHTSISAWAKDQYIIEEQLPYERGEIFLSDKKYPSGYYPMALNDDRYQVLVVPKNVVNPRNTADKLSQMIGKDSNEIFDEINNDKLYVPPIAKGLDKEKADAIVQANLEGVMIMAEQARLYPEDNLASQVMGFVDAGGIGRYGLEGYYNDDLTGKSGEISAEKDILGRFISIGSQVDPEDGANIYSTIDRNIQYVSQEYLKNAISEMQADDGTIIIVNPEDGSILSMASTPDFNPNEYDKVAEEHPDYFTNSVVSDVWEPGSIMKPIVMSMAIDLGKVEPDTQDNFGGSVTIQGYTIKNAMDRTFGRETMTKVLENSDNIAMTWLSQKMSDEEMYNYFSDYGFGNYSGIDLEGDATGYILDLADWREISHATMSFGQGISVTPLQMVMAFSTLANDGKLMKPRVVNKIVKSNGEEINIGPEEVKQVVKEETANKITDMLVSVVNNGYDLQGRVEGYKIAGKTGTAQIPDENGGYKEKEFIHSFAGYFPADDPQYTMLIILKNPKKYNFASSTCAPYFSKLARWLLNYSEIKPTN